MGPRIKQPGPEPAQISHSHQDTRAAVAAQNYINRCLLSKIRIADTTTVAISPETGLNGSELIEVLSSGASDLYEQPETAEVDISTTGLGGLVSGVSLVDGDYLFWAFIDPSSSTPFKGFGATKRPVEECSGINSGTGAKGSTTTYGSLASANGMTFTVGSRVIIQQGTAEDWTKDWNQGVVKAKTGDLLTVEMDSESYGAAIVNAPMLITQTDRYQPLTKDKGEAYGGYRYAYLGSAQLDDDVLTYTRLRGEFYYRPTEILLNLQTPAVGPTSYTVNTGMFVGSDTREIQIYTRAKRGADKQAWDLHIGARTVANQFLILSDNAALTGEHWNDTTLRIPVRADGTGVSMTWASTKGGEINVYLEGWRETRF